MSQDHAARTILGALLLINFAAMSTIKYSRNPNGRELNHYKKAVSYTDHSRFG